MRKLVLTFSFACIVTSTIRAQKFSSKLDITPKRWFQNKSENTIAGLNVNSFKSSMNFNQLDFTLLGLSDQKPKVSKAQNQMPVIKPNGYFPMQIIPLDMLREYSMEVVVPKGF